jgi:hypothetical protein
MTGKIVTYKLDGLFIVTTTIKNTLREYTKTHSIMQIGGYGSIMVTSSYKDQHLQSKIIPV